MNNNEKKWVSLMRLGGKLGCHQIPERSFFYKGYQFPVCARCTGVLLSVPISIYILKKYKLSVRVALLMSEIMLIDWGIQYLGIKESTNARRLTTGLIGGIGFHVLYFKMIIYLIKKIYHFIGGTVNFLK